jgi:hypothetical protein
VKGSTGFDKGPVEKITVVCDDNVWLDFEYMVKEALNE